MKKSETSTSYPPVRLHPVSVLFFIGKTVKDLVYPFLAFFISTIVRGNINWLWVGGGVALFLILLISISTLSWYRFVYYVESAGIRIEHGIWVRKKLWLSKERVQSVDTSAGLLLRAFDLVKLQVETAGGKKPEAVLSAIPYREAERIRHAFGLDNGPGHAVEAAQTVSDPIAAAGTAAVSYPEQTDLSADSRQTDDKAPAHAQQRVVETRSLGIRDLLLFSATSGRIGVVIAVVGAVYSQFREWLEQLFSSMNLLSTWFNMSTIGYTIAALLIAAWLVAIVLTSVKEYGFTLKLLDDRLQIERGLLERKQVSVPLHRIQAIHLSQNMLRRLFGLVSVNIVTAGYAGKEGSSAMLYPLLHERQVADFLNRFAPQFNSEVQWQPVERKALMSFATIPLLLSLLAAVPAIIWIPDNWGWLACILPLFTVIWAILSYQNTAWSHGDKQLAISYGSFSKHRAFIPIKRVQWRRVTQTPFQRRKRLATFVVALASGIMPAMFYIQHMPHEKAASLLDWLRNK
ncbi:hypothetical protein EBB07_12630 [Paenibacillaceae bacterium]|nr:hypothetical protein EBB07_12630 [Paenibacillaceae bacterium]